MDTKRYFIRSAKWLCALFPIIVDIIFTIFNRMGYSFEHANIILIVTLVCIACIPFNFAIQSIVKRDSMARVVAIMFPLGLWLIIAIMYVIKDIESSVFMHSLPDLLTLLASIIINLLPQWICIFLITTDRTYETDHSELISWSWPMAVPAFFAIFFALSVLINTVGVAVYMLCLLPFVPLFYLIIWSCLKK